MPVDPAPEPRFSSRSAASLSCSRRTFLRRALAGVAGAALLPVPAWAQSPPMTHASGVQRAPSLAHLVLQPDTPALQTAVLQGGAMGAEEAAYNASLFGTNLTHETFLADSLSDLSAAAAEAARASCIVAHLPDEAAVETALAATEDRGSLLFNTGAVDDGLRRRSCHPRLFHVTASHAQRTGALAQWAGSQDIASVSLLAGVLGDAASTYASTVIKQAGIEVAEVVETIDALGDGPVWVSHGTPADAFAALGDGRLVLAPVMTPEARGVAHGPVLWHASLFKYGATQVSERFARRADQPMDGPAYANWLAMQIAADAVAQTGSTDPAALRTYLRTQTRFDGRKAAPISFRSWNQQSRHELYIAQPSGERPVAATVPARMPDAPDARTKALDALGFGDNVCNL